jgi:3-isopropylmalate/(R)-2-methylmalate dehydratase small subunit
MESFHIICAKAAPMLAANIDTDVIMPKQFLKGIDRKGLAQGVFFDQRFLASGEKNPDFILNKTPWKESKFLVVGPNFGCGSSREHAVWGLKQLGIKAIVGTSFAGIFYDNCERNGVLLIHLKKNKWQTLADTVSRAADNEISIDLPEQEVVLSNGDSIDFEIDGLYKKALINGVDAIGSTLEKMELIKSFEKKHLEANPWLKQY